MASENLPSQLASTPAHPSTMTSQLESTSLSVDSPLPTPLLTTSRLIIRSQHPQDAPSMAAACAPASIAKYMSNAFAHPYTLTDAETWININLTQTLPNYVLTLHSSPGTVIGGIGLKPGSDVMSHTAEVGYWLAEECQGKGYTTEALRAFTEYVFENEVLGRIYRKLWAGVCGGNDASMVVLLKCGYIKEGCQRGMVEKNGVVRDMHLFGLTRGEWPGGRNEKGGA